MKFIEGYRGFQVVFELRDIEPAMYVRTIQEVEMLKTRCWGYNKSKKRIGPQPSFYELWYENNKLRRRIAESLDPNEEIWKAGAAFGYSMAKNFMPMYAKNIYEHFDAISVLDPCAGWGDRMAGALSSSTVKKYVGFDPNFNLRPGYARIMRDFSKPISSETPQSVYFDEGMHAIHSVCYEKGDALLEGSVFDFAFTSPPYFLLEDYGPHMPRYSNWLEDFYRPLFEITHKHLKPLGHFVVFVNDSTAGKVLQYILHDVPQFTSFRLKEKVGLFGGCSGKLHNGFVFQRGPEPSQ